MKNHPILLLFVVSNFLLVSCAGDHQLSREQRLRQSISELEKRFEKRKLSRIVEYVSANYHDKSGRGLTDIKRAIQLQLMRHKTLYIFSTINEVNWIDDTNVNVQITAAMTGKPINSLSLLKSIRADMIKFNVLFVLDDEIYKVQSATWEWANLSDFLH